MLQAKNLINKKFLIGVIILAVLLAVPAVVKAQTAPKNTPAGSTLEQRVAQRKAERQISLDENNTKRIENQCTNAQGKLRSTRDSYTSSSNNRNNAYRAIDAKLWIIIGSLKLIDKDTFKLEQERLEYLKKINTFDELSTQFRQTVDDAMEINCKADPSGFVALIETSRIYNEQIRKSFQEIRSYLIDQIKPTITEYANDLKLKPSTE